MERCNTLDHVQCQHSTLSCFSLCSPHSYHAFIANQPTAPACLCYRDVGSCQTCFCFKPLEWRITFPYLWFLLIFHIHPLFFFPFFWFSLSWNKILPILPPTFFSQGHLLSTSLHLSPCLLLLRWLPSSSYLLTLYLLSALHSPASPPSALIALLYCFHVSASPRPILLVNSLIPHVAMRNCCLHLDHLYSGWGVRWEKLFIPHYPCDL